MGCTKEGILKAAQVEIYTNSGCTLDLSPAVLHRAMWHVDNAYFIPHWRVVGRNCRTNVPSNTAFRGFGGPQGMLVAETFISKVAEVRAEEGKWEGGKRWRVGRRPCGLQFDKVRSLCLNFSNFFCANPLLAVSGHLPFPCKVCGLDPTAVRQRNLYQEGDPTHYGQPVADCHIRQCWEELAQKVDFTQRRAQVESFNKLVCGGQEGIGEWRRVGERQCVG